jgi:hypothetical protein
MLFAHRQVVSLQCANVCLNRSFNVGECGILRRALGNATGQAETLGNPEAILAAINEHLSHKFIVHPQVREWSA